MDEVGTPLRIVRKFRDMRHALYILGRTREAYRRQVRGTYILLRKYEAALRQAIIEIKKSKQETERYQRLYDELLREKSQWEEEVQVRVEEVRMEVAENVDGLTPEEVLAFFRENDGSTQKEAIDYFETTYPTLRRRIDVLIEEGKLVQKGHSFHIQNREV